MLTEEEEFLCSSPGTVCEQCTEASERAAQRTKPEDMCLTDVLFSWGHVTPFPFSFLYFCTEGWKILNYYLIIWKLKDFLFVFT